MGSGGSLDKPVLHPNAAWPPGSVRAMMPTTDVGLRMFIVLTKASVNSGRAYGFERGSRFKMCMSTISSVRWLESKTSQGSSGTIACGLR